MDWTAAFMAGQTHPGTGDRIHGGLWTSATSARRRRAPRARLLVALVAALAAGCGSGSSGGAAPGGGNGPRTVIGESREIFGATASVWAQVAADGEVEAVGLTLPFAAIENAPSGEGEGHAHHGEPDLGGVLHESPSGEHPHGGGDGPAGAVAVLAFPEVVRRQTVLDHLELHWNPSGHEPETVYSFPHYDFHFYTVPENEVRAVDCANPAPVPPERMPIGYFLPAGCVPEMGQHAFDPTSPEYSAVDPKFTETFLIGFWNGSLTFLEPMITKEYLLGRPDFARGLPVPEMLGRSTTYPTLFTGTYDASSDSYEMVFTNFVPVS